MRNSRLGLTHGHGESRWPFAAAVVPDVHAGGRSCTVIRLFAGVSLYRRRGLGRRCALEPRSEERRRVCFMARCSR